MNKAMWWGIGVVLVVAASGFAYWTISPFFRNVKIDEALPIVENQEQGSLTPEEPMQASVPQNATSQIDARAEVVGTKGHPASGTVRIVEAGDKTYVRYENFKTINGPDIFVYLAKDKNAKEFINLGSVKATEGNINYEIPAGVNVLEYPYVLTWCRAFGVLFNSAQLF